MKTKMIATILMASMFLGTMSGCGSNADTKLTSQNQEEMEVETVIDEEEESVDENIIEEDVKEEAIEEIAEEEIVEEVVDEFDEKIAMEKVTRLLNAYIDITNYENQDNYACIFRAENGVLEDGYIIESLTSDGISLNCTGDEDWSFKNEVACANVYFTYLYDYVNNNGTTYDFSEYISAHTLDEILYNYNEKDYIDKVLVDGYLYDEFLMFHAAKLVPWIVQYTHDNEVSIELKDLVTEGFLIPEVSGIPVAYQYDLYFGSDFSGLKVVFDAEGNMLNIVDTYGKDDSVKKGLSEGLEDYVYTF